MGVMMQAFYWNCPREENREMAWWKEVARRVPELKQAGFTSLWLPPASKAANIGGMSMGYDVYDYFDLGKYDQKGSIPTWYGTEEELRGVLRTLHDHGMKGYADVILNHNNGADEQEYNPITSTMRWTRFRPASGRFPRNWTYFHPSPYESADPSRFGDMPDLCHINPRVSAGILEYARWLVEEVGYDGFRYDFVKGFSGWIIRAIHDMEYKRGGEPVTIFGVGECWDDDFSIDRWLDSVNPWSPHQAGAFDFPLRYRLKELCDSYGYSLRNLFAGGTLMEDRPFEAVTFVDNHDFRDEQPEIASDKMLAYAVILTHEGYPCVYWKDYYRYGLALPGEPSGIEALVRVHEGYAGGHTATLYLDDTLYVMEREGFNRLPGLLFVLNSSGNWQKKWVRTRWNTTPIHPRAWRGKDSLDTPETVTTGEEGWVEVEAPPRGYTVYTP